MKFKILKRKIKSIKNKEKPLGRSMVEMLGVLAIIGVFSIGGISGYTIAMRRYRSNEILQVAETKDENSYPTYGYCGYYNDAIATFIMNEQQKQPPSRVAVYYL